MNAAPLRLSPAGQPAVFRPFWEQFRSERTKEPAEKPRPYAGIDLAELFADQRGLSASRSLVIDFLYDDFVRRCENGEEIDVVSFCDRFPSLKDSLTLAIWTYLTAQRAAESEEVSAPWPPPGAAMQGFFLDEVLGEGSFARVYLARDGTLGMRPAVIKLCRGDLTEAHILGRLNHPNIVPVHSVLSDEDTGLTAICMPYLGRATLADVLQHAFAGGQRPRRATAILKAAQDARQPDGVAAAPRLLRQGTYIEGVVSVAAQVADALASVHAQGICHRDLKPSNILITPAGRPILLDFNLSATRPVNPERVGGTLGYMAPEQVSAFRLGDRESYPAPAPAADIYAFGVLLYELLSGRHPFGPLDFQLTPPKLARQIQTRQQHGFRPLTRRGDGVEAWLSRLVERCLAHDVHDRTITAAELAAELRRGLSWTRRWRRRLLSPTGLLTATPLLSLALAVGGVGAWQAMPVSPERQLFQAREAYGHGQYPETVASLSHLLNETPGQAQALFLRGRAYQKMGQLDEALRDYQAAASLGPNGEIEAALGYCLSLTKRYKDAAEAYRAAIHDGFATAAVYSNLGYGWRRLGRFEQAVQCLNKAIELDGHLQSAYHNRALVGMAARGHAIISLERSAADLGTAIRLGPGTARLFYDAARINCLLIDRGPKYRVAAVAYLRYAVELGIRPNRLKKEWTFRRLQQDPEYRALLAQPASETKAIEPVLLPDPLANQGM